jgi:putative ABC transport system permease protein
MSFDSTYPDAERIYRIQRTIYRDNTKSYDGPRINAPLPGVLMTDLAEVENGIVVFSNSSEVFLQNDEHVFKEKILTVDAGFFDMFGIRLMEGDAKMLDVSGQIFLSHTAARRFFAAESPVGKVLMLDTKPLTVAGVFEDMPENNHLKHDFLLSIPTLWGTQMPGWLEADAFFGYVKLAEGIVPRDVESKIPGILPKYFDVKAETEKGNTFEYFLNPVSKIHISEAPVKQNVLILSLLTFSLLFITIMNYVLIALSSLSKRTMSISVHKCNGATTKDIFSMLIAETIVLIVVAFLLSAVLVYVFRRPVEEIIGTPLIAMFSLLNVWTTLMIMVLLILFSGIIPAIIFSKLSPTYLFQTYSVNKKKWKTVLLFLQLASVAFVIFLLTVSVKQYDLLVNVPLGYTTENVFYAEDIGKSVSDEQFDHLKTELQQLPSVVQVSISTHLPMDYLETFQIFDDNNEEELFASRGMAVDKNFFATMQIDFTDGKGFRESKLNYSEAVVNEEFIHRMKWEKDSSVGKTFVMRFDGIKVVKIIGVVNDFRTYTLYLQNMDIQSPLIIFSKEEGSRDWWHLSNRLIVRIHPASDTRAFATLEGKLKEIFNNKTAYFASYSEKIRLTYMTEEKYRRTVMLASIILSLITLFGLFGYTQDEILRRKKEMTLRKIYGATKKNLHYVFIRHLLLISLPAIVTGFILSYYISSNWIQQFAIKISLSLALFFIVGCCILSSLLACVILQVVKHTNENIVVNLKTT